jgi:hypothetical protein
LEQHVEGSGIIAANSETMTAKRENIDERGSKETRAELKVMLQKEE